MGWASAWPVVMMAKGDAVHDTWHPFIATTTPATAGQVPLSEEERREREDKRPDKMAIGVEGGFQLDAKDYRVDTEEVCVCV